MSDNNLLWFFQVPTTTLTNVCIQRRPLKIKKKDLTAMRRRVNVSRADLGDFMHILFLISRSCLDKLCPERKWRSSGVPGFSQSKPSHASPALPEPGGPLTSGFVDSWKSSWEVVLAAHELVSYFIFPVLRHLTQSTDIYDYIYSTNTSLLHLRCENISYEYFFNSLYIFISHLVLNCKQ